MRWSIWRSALVACGPRHAPASSSRTLTTQRNLEKRGAAPRPACSIHGGPEQPLVVFSGIRLPEPSTETLVSFRASRAAGSGGRSRLMPWPGGRLFGRIYTSGNPLPLYLRNVGTSMARAFAAIVLCGLSSSTERQPAVAGTDNIPSRPVCATCRS
jgi:hypothetical protein